MDKSSLGRKGVLFVFSGPSGAGKGTVCRALQRDKPSLLLSISATTRQPRSGEVDGVHYFFLKKEAFEEMIKKDQFLEWAEVYSQYYGTPRCFVEEALDGGKDIILEIDIQGALQVKAKFPDAVLIFIAPPSRDELKARLLARNTDSQKEIEKRLRYTADEMKLASRYDYIVMNDEVSRALDVVRAIITAEKARPRHFQSFLKQFSQ